MAKKPTRLDDAGLERTLNPLYNNPAGYAGAAALHARLPAGSASLKRVKAWIASQAVGGYLQTKPPPVEYATFDEQRPNRIHQADVLYLPHDKVGRSTYKYALTLVDVASRYKAAEPLTGRTAELVAAAMARIYKRSTLLAWPHTMMVDQGTEFHGATTKLLSSHGVIIRRADPGHHRSQAFVESFNKVLGQRLFRAMYAIELKTGSPSMAWVRALPDVVADLNATKTRLTGLAPDVAIGSASARVPLRSAPAAKETPQLDPGTLVHVTANEEAKSVDEKRRATDPYWTAKQAPIVRVKERAGQPTLYYVAGQGNHGWTSSQLRV